ncbi:MAG: DUF4105 domain-containing protein [Spirochaetes bacterium]|nr:DUF4105 domain-containing protein [Spirochaetota bacterium]
MNNLLSKKSFFTSVFILAAIFTVTAQNIADDRIILSESSVISMITVYPGDRIYSLFGHSAFRVYDPENGIDLMYNYGTFDFTDDFFVLRFMQGRLYYYLDVVSFQRALHFYSVFERRKVFEQVLGFDLEQRQALFDFLEENARPENRVYRYDFIWDNCSTRIADAIERTFPGLVDFSAFKGYGETFRKMIMSYLGATPFTNFGIQLAFGKKTDRIPQGHEILFLPLYMKAAFSAATMKNADNEIVPFVIREEMLASPERTFYYKPDYPLFIFLSVLIIYLISLVLIFFSKKSVVLKLSGIMSKLCEGFIFLFTGIASLLIGYLWFISEHTVTSSNLSFLWCSPLSLALFAGIFIKKNSYFKKRLFKSFSALSVIMCVVYLICIAFGVQYALPAFFPIIMFLIIAGARKLCPLCSDE